jgi:AhpD family alkylhydroperoxidase
MSRMPGITDKQAGPLTRIMFRMVRKRLDRVPETFRVVAHHKTIMRGGAALELALERSHGVDERLKELAVLKAATLVGCEFCIDIGSAMARRSGVTAEQLADLPRHRESVHFGELEKLVLDYAAAMTRTPAEVSDELFAALREHFDERQMVELTAMIAHENSRARFNGAFDLGAEGFTEGMACARPELPLKEPAASSA